MLKRILDEDHYGLEDVKERIVEYLAVRSLVKEEKEKERFFV
jgi:ATP-dependent Lon protease